MTGYGSATADIEGTTVAVEARSVNSRGLRVVVKGPPGTEGLETALRELIESFVKRGRLDFLIRIEERSDGGPARILDDDRVREILTAMERLRDEFGIGGVPDIATVMGQAGLFVDRARDDSEALAPDSLSGPVEAALAGLVEMRAAEGARLAADLRERLQGITAGLDAAEALAPERLERERRRLLEAVEEVAGKGFDDDRIAREVALIADRWDVGEELVRARAHVEAFEEYLGEPAAEPVGKRLGFLVQELQREVNTLGAKANDPRISRHVVEMKNEIEKLREQVENVE
jgi:uncharacterized protein (TIGR00255 family)